MPIPEKISLSTGDATKWHTWFAWFPVRTIDGRRAWMRRIYRRDFYPAMPQLPGKIVQYVTFEKLVEMRLAGDTT